MAKKKPDAEELTTDLQDSVDADVATEAQPAAAVTESAPSAESAPQPADEENAWHACEPRDESGQPVIDVHFVAAALGIPTGNAEERIAKCNEHERAGLIEARKDGSHHHARAVMKNCANRLSKPKIEKGTPLGKG